MKYELETIPVWDGVRGTSECFLCELMKEAESHAVSYYLGSSVMHPETRVEVNRTGFCPFHWTSLVKAGKPQSLALIGHTYLEESLSRLSPAVSRIAAGKPGRKTVAAIGDLLGTVEERERGCLVCARMEERLKRYAFTTIHLWRKDEEFRTEFSESKGVCLHHMETLLAMAPDILDSSETQDFSTELTALVVRNLQRLEREIWWMTQKYKAEHIDDPWNGCEDAHKRLVCKITGEGRVVWPS